ncbi:MAG: hypothetical protein AAGJ93_10525, partial [Bacteroidota bacterium]
MKKKEKQIPKIFLEISRILLAERPIFAQLLASMTKVARPELKSIFALGFHQTQPLLYYQADRLIRAQENGLNPVLVLQEELLHFLLKHPTQQNQYPIQWAFHLAADL